MRYWGVGTEQDLRIRGLGVKAPYGISKHGDTGTEASDVLEGNARRHKGMRSAKALRR